MTTEAWVIPFITHPLVLRVMTVIALAAIFYVLHTVASYVERIRTQRPRQTKSYREFGQGLVPCQRRNLIWYS